MSPQDIGMALAFAAFVAFPYEAHSSKKSLVGCELALYIAPYQIENRPATLVEVESKLSALDWLRGPEFSLPQNALIRTTLSSGIEHNRYCPLGCIFAQIGKMDSSTPESIVEGVVHYDLDRFVGVVAHELGHGIFEVNWRSRRPELYLNRWNELGPDGVSFEDWTRRRTELARRVIEFIKRGQFDGDELEETIDELDRYLSYSGPTAGSRVFSRDASLMQEALEEWFADLVAVITLRDPEGVANNHGPTLMRTFRRVSPLPEIEGNTLRDIGSMHGIFFLARRGIWEKYYSDRSPGDSLDYDRRVLANALEASFRFLEELPTGSEDYLDLEYESVNQRLLSLLAEIQ